MQKSFEKPHKNCKYKHTVSDLILCESVSVYGCGLNMGMHVSI